MTPGRTIGASRLAEAVQVLRWPAESDRRDPGRACLWILPLGELPPAPVPGEDWVRVSADERDASARLRQLARRHGGGAATVVGAIDAEGRVESDGTVVVLPPLEAQLYRCLHERIGRVVTRVELGEAAWGTGPTGRALDGRIHALRTHLRPLDLEIHTIRGRGFLLLERER